MPNTPPLQSSNFLDPPDTSQLSSLTPKNSSIDSPSQKYPYYLTL